MTVRELINKLEGFGDDRFVSVEIDYGTHLYLSEVYIDEDGEVILR